MDIRSNYAAYLCATVIAAALLADHLTAYPLLWLGHMVRMDEGRLPYVALLSRPYGVEPCSCWLPASVLCELCAL